MGRLVLVKVIGWDNIKSCIGNIGGFMFEEIVINWIIFFFMGWVVKVIEVDWENVV